MTAPRVWLKLLLRRFFLLPSFCRRCGCKVRDFVADDATWERVQPMIQHGNTLCYNCFCDLTGSRYRLVTIAEAEAREKGA